MQMFERNFEMQKKLLVNAEIICKTTGRNCGWNRERNACKETE